MADHSNHELHWGIHGGLDERAEVIVPTDEGVIMLPESAFVAALEASDDSAKAIKVDAATRLKAVELAAIGNDPATLIAWSAVTGIGAASAHCLNGRKSMRIPWLD